MNLTPRVQAMQEFAAALRLMTGVRPWGGQYPNDPTVSLEDQSPQQINRWPHFILTPDSGSYTDPGAQESYDDCFAVMVIGYVAGTATIPAWEMVQHAIRDCKITLLAASRHGAVVRIDLGDRDVGREEIAFDGAGHASFILPFMATLEDPLA